MSRTTEFSDPKDGEWIGKFSILNQVTCSPDEELFLARTLDHSTVFLKRLSIAYRFDRNRRLIFKREARFARKLDHPNIANFIGMEEIDGEMIQLYRWSNCIALSELLRLCKAHRKRIPSEIGISLAHQIVSALQYLISKAASENTERLTLHVGLRPDAVFVTDDGRCQLVQISQILPPSISTSIINPELYQYMVYAAPEQCVPGIEPDLHADLYTLGVLIFELLTSKPLFYYSDRLDKALINRRKVRNLHPLLSDVARDLAVFNDIVNGLLQPLPRNRSTDLVKIIDSFKLALGNWGNITSNSDVAAFVSERLNQAESCDRDSDRESMNKPSALSTIAEYNSS